MSAPKRIQLSRKKGWRMPPNTVKVDRSTRWGNPYRIGEAVDRALVQRWGWHFSPHGLLHVCESAAEAVCCFEHALLWDGAIHPFVREQLGGKNLACWCPHDQDCHADALLWLANSTREKVDALHEAIDKEIMAGRAEPSIAELRRRAELAAPSPPSHAEKDG